LIIILLIERFTPPAFARLSILLGLVIGTLMAVAFGLTDFSHWRIRPGAGSARRSTSSRHSRSARP